MYTILCAVLDVTLFLADKAILVVAGAGEILRHLSALPLHFECLFSFYALRNPAQPTY